MNALKPCREFLVIHAALFQHQDQTIDQLALTSQKELSSDVVFIEIRRQVKNPHQIGAVTSLPKGLTPRRDRLCQAIEITAAEMLSDSGDAMRHIAFCQVVHDFTTQERRGTVFDFGKLRAHAGFQGKPSEKTRAERVNCLNLQSAWRFNGAGEQRAGLS